MEKRELRTFLRSEPGPEPSVQIRVVEGLFAWMSARLPGTVSAFLAMDDEVDVEPLFERLPGWHWVLPRVEEDGSLTLRDRDLPREVHRFGMAQPVGAGESVPVHELDVILVPGLAFDRAGKRLGRGGGFYDRLLDQRRNDCVALGVTWEARVMESVPTEGHDRTVDLLASEDGVSQTRS